jgi:hypothetical protein
VQAIIKCGSNADLYQKTLQSEESHPQQNYRFIAARIGRELKCGCQKWQRADVAFKNYRELM